ncbi:MAG: hypothetical protein KGL48_04580 [Sphingomonadales bacterium]|nr:hypothetical protein [Sphingomonadales bacterium]MDE2567504.1 hypothetical protein [Sphingomonadales bacterium]
MTIFSKAALAAGMGAMALAVSAPAQARGYHRGGGDDAAIAVGAGLVGLVIGAAIASSDNDDRYYDSYYGGPRGYYAGPSYYEAYPAYPVYRGGYYYRSYPAYRGYYREAPHGYYRGGHEGWRGYHRNYRDRDDD